MRDIIFDMFGFPFSLIREVGTRTKQHPCRRRFAGCADLGVAEIATSYGTGKRRRISKVAGTTNDDPGFDAALVVVAP
jgi:hypothetical protein